MEEYVSAFEQMLYDLKWPFLNNTDINNTQSVEYVTERVDKNIQDIYNSVSGIIQTIVSKRDQPLTEDTICSVVTPEQKTICQLMQQEGLSYALYENKGLEGELVTVMNRVLKEYPYIPKKRHTNIMKRVKGDLGTPQIINNTVSIVDERGSRNKEES